MQLTFGMDVYSGKGKSSLFWNSLCILADNCSREELLTQKSSKPWQLRKVVITKKTGRDSMGTGQE